MPKALTIVVLASASFIAGPSFAGADSHAVHDRNISSERAASPQQREWFRRTIEHMLDEASSVASRERLAR